MIHSHLPCSTSRVRIFASAAWAQLLMGGTASEQPAAVGAVIASSLTSTQPSFLSVYDSYLQMFDSYV